eukprot:CAMPEP_0181308562 /NCGR_PEP_ID=MMETSP1101-20121128/11534_1 /TAXON_ID=46948 /ORGANISM="Rhodomonas abbreviata, Strain Caron Lab Isolate" /LENGTH=251 /DNA_ID=CAMNT_0023414963 /DNA_START=29 /DNA_END=785 /DNA_ORIENTATION=-
MAARKRQKQLTPAQQAANGKPGGSTRKAKRERNQAAGAANEVARKVCGTALCEEQPTVRLMCKHRRCAQCIGEMLYFNIHDRNFCAFRCPNGRVSNANKVADLVAKAKRDAPKIRLEKASRDASHWVDHRRQQPAAALLAVANRKQIGEGTRVWKKFHVKFMSGGRAKNEKYFGRVLGFTKEGHLVIEWEPESIVDYQDIDGKMKRDVYGVIHVSETHRARDQSAPPAPIPDEVWEHVEADTESDDATDAD